MKNSTSCLKRNFLFEMGFGYIWLKSAVNVQLSKSLKANMPRRFDDNDFEALSLKVSDIIQNYRATVEFEKHLVFVLLFRMVTTV